VPVLKPGSRLRSATCTTEVMVIQAPAADVDLTCGGAPMQPLGGGATPASSGATGSSGSSASAREAGARSEQSERSQQMGTLIGKRYVNAAGDLELLCTRPGAGTLALGGAALTVKGAKPLPSSD